MGIESGCPKPLRLGRARLSHKRGVATEELCHRAEAALGAGWPQVPLRVVRPGDDAFAPDALKEVIRRRECDAVEADDIVASPPGSSRARTGRTAPPPNGSNPTDIIRELTDWSLGSAIEDDGPGGLLRRQVSRLRAFHSSMWSHFSREDEDVLVEVHTTDLNRWARAMVTELGLGVTAPRVSVERLNAHDSVYKDSATGEYRTCRGIHGVYRWCWRGSELHEDIVLDRRHLLHDSRWEYLMSLVHELVHSWQERNGHSHGPMHGEAFRAKARELGLDVSRSGTTTCVVGHTAFLRLLRDRDVRFPDQLWN